MLNLIIQQNEYNKKHLVTDSQTNEKGWIGNQLYHRTKLKELERTVLHSMDVLAVNLKHINTL